MNEVSHCGANEPFALRVIGDDMAPEFNDGHIVIVDPGGLIKNGSYVIAQVGQETVLRQLRIKNGKYYLHGSPSKTVEETDLHKVIGVVSQKAGRRRRDSKRYDI